MQEGITAQPPTHPQFIHTWPTQPSTNPQFIHTCGPPSHPPTQPCSQTHVVHPTTQPPLVHTQTCGPSRHSSTLTGEEKRGWNNRFISVAERVARSCNTSFQVKMAAYLHDQESKPVQYSYKLWPFLGSSSNLGFESVLILVRGLCMGAMNGWCDVCFVGDSMKT